MTKIGDIEVEYSRDIGGWIGKQGEMKDGGTENKMKVLKTIVKTIQME